MEEEQQFLHIADSSWPVTVLHVLKMLLKQAEFCDVTIKLDDQSSLQAHSCVLSSIPLVKTLLLNSKVIYIKGISRETWVTILEFLYSGSLLFKFSSALEGLKSAVEVLQFKEMLEVISCLDSQVMSQNSTEREDLAEGEDIASDNIFQPLKRDAVCVKDENQVEIENTRERADSEPSSNSITKITTSVKQSTFEISVGAKEDAKKCVDPVSRDGKGCTAAVSTTFLSREVTKKSVSVKQLKDTGVLHRLNELKICPFCREFKFTDDHLEEFIDHLDFVHCTKNNTLKDREIEVFRSSALSMLHILPKTGDKEIDALVSCLFVCPLCYYVHTDKADYQKHLSSVHNWVGGSITVCHLCNKYCERINKLIEHYAKAHSIFLNGLRLNQLEKVAECNKKRPVEKSGKCGVSHKVPKLIRGSREKYVNFRAKALKGKAIDSERKRFKSRSHCRLRDPRVIKLTSNVSNEVDEVVNEISGESVITNINESGTMQSQIVKESHKNSTLSRNNIAGEDKSETVKPVVVNIDSSPTKCIKNQGDSTLVLNNISEVDVTDVINPVEKVLLETESVSVDVTERWRKSPEQELNVERELLIETAELNPKRNIEFEVSDKQKLQQKKNVKRFKRVNRLCCPFCKDFYFFNSLKDSSISSFKQFLEHLYFAHCTEEKKLKEKEAEQYVDNHMWSNIFAQYKEVEGGRLAKEGKVYVCPFCEVSFSSNTLHPQIKAWAFINCNLQEIFSWAFM